MSAPTRSTGRTRTQPFVVTKKRPTPLQQATLLLIAALSSSAHADEPATEDVTAPDVIRSVENTSTTDAVANVTVTARKREELIQNVPLPETAISGSELARDGAVTLTDFAEKAPNLQVSATNSRQSSVALRGLGKNSANETIQGSVGVIVDGVVFSQAGMSWGDYIDLDQVEVLRGPQGTLQGKNTTLGAVVISTKVPSFTPEYTFQGSYGSLSTWDVKGSATGPIVDGLLAYRWSFYDTQGDGPIANIYTPLGGTWQGPDRFGTRFQSLLTASDDLTARLIIDYSASHEHGNLSPYISDPTKFETGQPRTITYTTRLERGYFGGYQPLIGAVTEHYTDLNSAQHLPVHQKGISVQVDKGLGDFTLTSISAYRYNDFDYRNDFDYTHFNIQTLSGTWGLNTQFTEELRLASPVSKVFDYQVGLFADLTRSRTLSRTFYGQDAGAFYATNSQYSALSVAQLQASLNNVNNYSEIDPRSRSIAAFAQGNWHITDQATLTLGVRDTDETVSTIYDKYSIGGAHVTGQALAIRAAQQGTLYGDVNAGAVTNNSVSWLINPAYQLDKDTLLYASASHGTKSGAVQLDSNGHSANVNPENALDYELGIKTSWLNHALFADANVYQTTITDYQSQSTVVSSTSSTGYASLLTNVGAVRLRGLELDGAWYITSGLHLNLGAAFNDPIYTSYHNATCPVELNVSKPCDFTGKQVASASKQNLTLGLDYKRPLSENASGHVFLTDVFRSSANLSTTLSDTTVQGSYSVVNGGIGIANAKGTLEVDLIGKNIFNKVYAINLGQYSNSAPVSEFYGDPRYVGISVRGKI